MEVLIFGVGGLVMLVIFLGVSALPAVIAHWIGRQFSARYVRWLLPCLVIGFPIGWAAAGYSTFKASCTSLPTQAFVFAPAIAPEGILSNAEHVYNADLIERGVFKFVESQQGSTKIRRDFAGEKQYPRSPIPVKTEWVPITGLKSEHVVTESMERQADRWWKPPIYMHTIEIKEVKSGRLLAKATDLVFGGDILGPYMRLLGGDQDFEYVSCGYASANVGAWRPSLASRPRFAQYREADAAFLTRALGTPSRSR